ncbi:hypothetical protein NFJ02_04g114730 [Pycnococcus provasolii]
MSTSQVALLPHRNILPPRPREQDVNGVWERTGDGDRDDGDEDDIGMVQSEVEDLWHSLMESGRRIMPQRRRHNRT